MATDIYIRFSAGDFDPEPDPIEVKKHETHVKFINCSGRDCLVTFAKAYCFGVPSIEIDADDDRRLEIDPLCRLTKIIYTLQECIAVNPAVDPFLTQHTINVGSGIFNEEQAKTQSA